MVTTNPKPASQCEPLFEAVINPHRSLGPVGFMWVMGLVAGISFIAGTVFLLVGAWPVIGFLGLDVALIYVAFRANYRAANAHESVFLTHDTLRISRVDDRGRRNERTLNPYWTRIEPERDEEFGLLSLTAVCKGERVRIADWLSPNEREEFCVAFTHALHKARSAPAT